ncbi:hypothetical protein SAMN04487948_101321 [Halogranum amylolyticum]|uniref:Ig-like domain-containing protein n=1 Tax=Halogranum amylolyticum TaxID=660520 RepID=A0A1H8N538_9EURY|nr:hypothetical protein [Halogranum amylolyticum]SEO24771.1 hypothetical protein SAMN04487948_101321 [Halogranum amylolyticum]
MRRRALLAALTATATAGCSGLTDFGDDTPTPPPRSTSGTPGTPEGTDTSDDLPYRGDDDARTVEPQGFFLQNQSDRERYVTVVVEHDGETLFVESETIPPRKSESNGRREYANLIAAAGIYRVVVETGDGGRTVHDWVVGRDVGGLFVVVEDDYVWSRQQIGCDPTCGPISLGGEAVETLPYVPESDEGERTPDYGTSNLVFANTGETPTEVHAIAEFDGQTLLDYRYDVRPGLQVAVPLVNGSGVVDLTLEADGTSEQYEWHVPEEQFVFSDLAEGVGVDCRLPRQYRSETDQRGVSLRNARNRSTESRTLTVTARADGERTADEEFELAPETRTPLGVRLQADDRLDLTLELATDDQATDDQVTDDQATDDQVTDDQATDGQVTDDQVTAVTAQWTVCPSRPQEFSVDVDADGALALLRWDRPVATSDGWTDGRAETETDEPTPVTTQPDDSTSTPAGTPGGTPESPSTGTPEGNSTGTPGTTPTETPTDR